MLHKRENLSDRGQLRRAGWLALVALAWVQLSSASHQFDHAAGDLADSCHVCVQLDRLDDAVAKPPQAAIGQAPVNADRLPTPPGVVDREIRSGFDARGPPQL